MVGKGASNGKRTQVAVDDEPGVALRGGRDAGSTRLRLGARGSGDEFGYRRSRPGLGSTPHRPACPCRGGICYTSYETRRTQAIEETRAEEARLSTFLDEMSDLIFDHSLRASQPGAEVRRVARTRTLLLNMGSERKRRSLKAVYELNLVSRTSSILSLDQADLDRAVLSEAVLPGIDLHGVYLRSADLTGADLRGADLGGPGRTKPI